MKKIFNLQEIVNSSCLILAIYFSLSFCFSDFGIPASVFGFLLFFLSLIFLCFRVYLDGLDFFIQQFKDKRVISLIVLFFVIFLNFIRVFSLNSTLIYYILLLFVGIVFFITTTKVSSNTLLRCLYIFVISGLFASTIIYIELFFHDFFISNILGLLTYSSQEYVIRLLNLGYGSSLGADISFTAYCIVFGMFSILSIYKKKNQKILLPMFIYQFFALIFLQRKSELLCFIFILFIYLTYIYIKKSFDLKVIDKKKIIRSSTIFIFILLLVFILVLILIPKDLISDNRIIQMLVDLKNGKDFTNGRLALYKVAFDLFVQYPLFGIGWGEFSKYAILTGNTQVRNVHCVYLQLLTEVGIVGAFLFISSILYIYINTLKEYFQKLSTGSNLLIFSVLTQTFFILLSFIDNALLLQHFCLIYPITLIIVFKFVEDIKENTCE